MKLTARIGLIVAAVGLVIVLAAAVLLQVASVDLAFFFGGVHRFGQFVTLLGLVCFLVATVADRRRSTLRSWAMRVRGIRDGMAPTGLAQTQKFFWTLAVGGSLAASSASIGRMIVIALLERAPGANMLAMTFAILQVIGLLLFVLMGSVYLALAMLNASGAATEFLTREQTRLGDETPPDETPPDETPPDERPPDERAPDRVMSSRLAMEQLPNTVQQNQLY